MNKLNTEIFLMLIIICLIFAVALVVVVVQLSRERNDVTKISLKDVLELLIKERDSYHYASRANIDMWNACNNCIKVIKLWHIEKHPTNYYVKKRVLTEEAKLLLTENEKAEQKLKEMSGISE